MSGQNHGFNWAQAWSERLDQSGLRANLNRRGIAPEKFWDNYNSWMEWHNQSNYPGNVIERIQRLIRPGSSLLDVGAGAGAYLVQLAKICSRVIAVEPSPGQVARLKENASQYGIENLVLIPRRWEDVDPEEVGLPDAVLAAYSFEMKEIVPALEKMLLVAKRFCFFVHTAGHDLLEPMRRIAGIRSGPDYIYLYNILYDLGFRANVEILTRRYSLPLELQMNMFSYNPGLDEEQQQRLVQFLEAHGKLDRHNGQTWITRQHKDALIWIEKEV